MPDRPRTRASPKRHGGAAPANDRSPLDAVSEHRNGAVLAVVVAPKSGTTAFDRRVPGAVRVRVAAPPVEGAANDALIRFLAEVIEQPRSKVRIVAGTTARRKRILFAGLPPAELRRRIAVLLPVAARNEKAPLSQDREREDGG